MKKILFLFVLLLWTWFFPLFAQQSDPTVSNLGDLLIRFCNDPEVAKEWWSKDLQFSTVPEKEEEICLYLVNGWPTDVDVVLWFVDGTITNDADQKKACQPEAIINQFWQYVKPEKTLFSIPANTTIETRAKITFPQDTAWMVYGCATLQLSGGTTNDWSIQVVSRRANFIDISVQWKVRPSLQILSQETPIWRMLHNKDPRFYIFSNVKTKELFGKIIVKNDGNVAQYVSMQPTTKRRWKTTDFETISKKILPQQENEFLIPITDKPRWEWGLTIDASITYSPVVEEWIELDIEWVDMNEQKIVVSANTLFMPWKLIFWFLWILFIWLLFTGKKKKHHNNKEEEEKKPRWRRKKID
jgi:hypothetical protein